ncbi:MAG: hypothetical protein GQ545_10255 [Candidatus Aminicenantes bacterium]|nr:hypothetical protein [Candidatus Aminicenantes bacterium]
MVDVEQNLSWMKDKLRVKLRENGISEEIISDFLMNIELEMNETNRIETGSKESGYKTQDRISIQGSEAGLTTYYGLNAGFSLTTGNYNTFLGYNAGYLTTEEDYNTFIGAFAGYQNTATGNTFVGHGAGKSNTDADENTCIGTFAGHNNTSGNGNTFMGYRAGYYSSTGFYNTFIGRRAGYNNKDSGNTFIGWSSGHENTDGYANVFLGYNAGFNNTSGHNNTLIGNNTGFSNETGNYNVFLGHKAGNFELGSNKLYIENSDTSSPLIYGEFNNDIVAINGKLGIGTQSPGYDLEIETTGKNAIFALDRTDGAKTVIASLNNQAAFGTLTNHPLIFAINAGWKMRLNTDNSLSMSNGATCTAGGVWQDASSRACKENIQDLSIKDAESALSALYPVKYNYKNDKEDEHLGFIAEDVPDLVASKDRKGMSPMDVVAVLTKVVQEQQDTITELQVRITKLEKKSQ